LLCGPLCNLLSGPPTLLIFIEPVVQVNHVPHAPPAEVDRWHAQLIEKRGSHAEIARRLQAVQAPDHWGAKPGRLRSRSVSGFDALFAHARVRDPGSIDERAIACARGAGGK